MGAAVGGVAGLLAGLGLMAIPGVGPVVAAGWLVSTLAGAAAGGVTGGVLGALTQAGISKEDAEVYAEGLRRGGAVVSARVADADAVRLQAVMDRSAVNIGERSAAYRQGGWNRAGRDQRGHGLGLTATPSNHHSKLVDPLQRLLLAAGEGG